MTTFKDAYDDLAKMVADVCTAHSLPAKTGVKLLEIQISLMMAGKDVLTPTETGEAPDAQGYPATLTVVPSDTGDAN